MKAAFSNLVSLLPIVTSLGCSETKPPAMAQTPDSVRTETAAITAAENGLAPAAQATPDPAADAALLRAYGSSDMALQTCMKRAEDGTIIGDNCPAGVLVFGPYVRIPKGATMHLTFDVQADKKIKVVSDVVSSGGQIFHGSMDEQYVEAKATRSIGYGIHMFQEVNAAEARIWVNSDGPANFKISNLKLVVL